MIMVLFLLLDIQFVFKYLEGRLIFPYLQINCYTGLHCYFAKCFFSCHFFLAFQDLETELGLTREKLIRMAMLLGSDYTEGVR